MKTRTIVWLASVVVGTTLATGLFAWVSGTALRYVDGDRIDVAARQAVPRRVLWQPPVPVPGASDATADEYEPRVTADGSLMVFVRGKPGANADLFCCRAVPGGWTPPTQIAELSTPSDELGPELSADGRRLYFYSDRPGGFGGYDLWVSTAGERGWGEPVNLGDEVNTANHEYGPALALGGDRLFFASNRPRPGEPERQKEPWSATLRETRDQHDFDLYCATITGETVVEVRSLRELNTAHDEGSPAVTPVGDFLYFSSNRPGGEGGFDLYRCRLEGREARAAENLGAPLNSAANDLDPALSYDGFRIHFSSDRQNLAATQERAAATSAGDAAGINDPTAPADYSVWTSGSREVAVRFESAEFWRVISGLWNRLWPWLGPIILIPLTAILLRRLFRDRQLAARFGRLSLLAQCVLLSLGVHVAIASLLTLWQVGSMVGEFLSDRSGSRVAIASSGIAGDVIGQLRDSTQLPLTTVGIGELPSASPMVEVALPLMPTPEPESIDPTPLEPLTIERTASEPKSDPSPFRMAELATGVEFNVSPGEQIAPERPAAEAPLNAPSADSLHSRGGAPAIAVVSSPGDVEFSLPESRATLEPRVEMLNRGSARSERARELVVPLAGESQLSEVAAAIPREAPAEEPREEPRNALGGGRLPPVTEVALPRFDVGASELTDERGAPRVPQTMPGLELAHNSAPRAEDPRRDRSTIRVAPSEAAGFGAIARSPSVPADVGPRAREAQPMQVATIDSLTLRLPLPSVMGAGGAPTEDAARLPAPRVDLEDLGQVVGTHSRLESSIRSIEPESDRSAERTPPPQAQASTSVRTPGVDPEPAPVETFAQRAPEVRNEVLGQMGGSAESERAVRAALEWFKRHQQADGRWSGRGFDATCGGCDHPAEVDSDVAMTGIVLLCYLGAGHTQSSDGPYQSVVRRGLDWLAAGQAASGDLRRSETMYSHNVGTVALCEAYAMTRDANARERAQRAVAFMLAPIDAAGSRQSGARSSDTSVLGWQAMAMASARRCGFPVTESGFAAIDEWLNFVAESPRSGRYSYRRGEAPSVAMTAEAMFVRQLLGHSRTEVGMQRSAEFILSTPPRWRDGAASHYWYYATLALFEHQGDAWRRWNEQVVAQLTETQRADGTMHGSWDPQDYWSKLGGRVYQTAISTLCLEVYYRYRPSKNSAGEKR